MTSPCLPLPSVPATPAVLPLGGLARRGARAAAVWTSYGGLENANGIISDLMAHVGEAAERRRRWQKEGVITFPPDMGDVTDEEMEEWLLVGIPPIDQFSPD